MPRRPAGTLYAPPGENNIEITGLHVVVIAVGVVAAASRPAARNRNRQLGQSMPNVRHPFVAARIRADFSAPTYTRAPFLFHCHPPLPLPLFSFPAEEGLPSAKRGDIASLAPRDDPRLQSDFPLHRRTSVGDCGIYAGPRLTIPSTAAPFHAGGLRASQTTFSVISYSYPGGPLRIDRETQSNQFSPLELR